MEAFKQRIKDLFEEQETFEIRRGRSALKDFATVNTVDGRDGHDPQSFLRAVRQTVTNLLRNNRRIKVKLVLNCNMEITSIVRGTVIEPSSFHPRVEVNLEGTNVDELYNTMVERILENIATFQMRGSQWTFNSIISLKIHSVRFEPLRGSSYIPLPKTIRSKKSIINIKNEDDMCFKWSVARALNPVERNAERITRLLREQAEELNMSGTEFPVKLKDIEKFEKQNPNISIKGFGYEGEIYPLRTSKMKQNRQTVNLLLISDEEKVHYCLIKNMSRLLSSQTNNHQHKNHFCLRCLNPFASEKSLEKHMEYCCVNEAVKIEMPEEGSIIKFQNFNRSMRVLFIVYADFESLIKLLKTFEIKSRKKFIRKNIRSTNHRAFVTMKSASTTRFIRRNL